MAKDTTSASIDISFQPTKCLVQYIYIYFCVFPFHPLLFFSVFLFLSFPNSKCMNRYAVLGVWPCWTSLPPRVTDQKNSVNRRCRPAMVHSIFIATISIYNIADGFYFVVFVPRRTCPCCGRYTSTLVVNGYSDIGGGEGGVFLTPWCPFVINFFTAPGSVYTANDAISFQNDSISVILYLVPVHLLCYAMLPRSLIISVFIGKNFGWWEIGEVSELIITENELAILSLSFPFHPCFMSSLIKNYIEKRVP